MTVAMVSRSATLVDSPEISVIRPGAPLCGVRFAAAFVPRELDGDEWVEDVLRPRLDAHAPIVYYHGQ